MMVSIKERGERRSFRCPSRSSQECRASRHQLFQKGEDMPDSNDWNRQTIEAFRANGGKVGGIWEGRPLLLLTTTGAKSGQSLTSPLTYLRDDDRLLVFSPTVGPPPTPHPH